MGAGWPKPALVEPFTAFQAWDHGKASEVVCVFKDNEFDFGVDIDVVAALLEGDRKTAEAVVAREQQRDPDRPIVTEVESIGAYYAAEAYHQQYLEKGGQSAKKGDGSTIRCYG